MDRVTLVDSGVVFKARFAAPSILTGFFVAAILDSSLVDVEVAFDDPGDILVENMNGLVAPVTYRGYRKIQEVREGENEITVILSKEESIV